MGKHIKIIIACCALAAASLGICVNADSVFFDKLCKIIGADVGEVAIHATLAGLAIGVFSPVAVRLLRVFPVQYLSCAGILLLSVASLLMGFVKSLPLLYVLGCARGVGIAFTSLTIVTIALCNWFVKRRGLALGLAMSFSGLMGAVCAPLFSWAIGALGYFGARALSAGLLLLTLPPAFFWLRLTPEEAGTRTLGEPESGESAELPGVRLKYASVLFITTTVFASALCSITAITSHLNIFAISIGLGASNGALMVSLCMVGNIGSKLLIGVLSDKIGVTRALVAMLGVTAASLAAFIIAPAELGALLPAALLFGAIYSIGAVGISMLVRAIYGSAGYSRAYALIAMISSFITAFAQSIFGFVYDSTGSYASVFGAALAIIGVCGALLIYFKLKRAINEIA